VNLTLMNVKLTHLYQYAKTMELATIGQAHLNVNVNQVL